MGHVQRTDPTRNFPKGGWEARYRDHNRKHHAKTFATKRDAERYLAQATTSLVTGDWVDPGLARRSFAQVADDWLATKPGGREQTRQGYESLLKNHVLPFFGKRQIGAINPVTIDQWLADRVAADVGPGTVRNAYRNVLKPILGSAVRQGLIRNNPAQGVKLPKSQPTEMLFLTAQQVQALVDELAEHYRPADATLVMFAAYTGMRSGEIAALRIRHLDMLRRRVSVEQSAARVGGKGIVYGPTKTYKPRTITLPRFLVPGLAAMLEERAPLSPDDFVFVMPTGIPMRHHHFYDRVFKPAVRAALPPHLHRLRFHDLRHTCASLLIDQGAQPKAVQEHLGHSSINITFDVYGHLFPGWREELSDKLDAVWEGTQDDQAGSPNRYPPEQKSL